MRVRANFKKTFIFIFTLALAAVSFSLIAYAHSGRTDANGGHYDQNTGEYHYHHGYPAHQHPNGVCPYDYDDKTDHTESEDDSENNGITNFLILLGLTSSAVLIYFIYSSIRTKKRNKQSEKFKNELLPLLNQVNSEKLNIQSLSYSFLRNYLNDIRSQQTKLELSLVKMNRLKIKSILISDYSKSFYADFPYLYKKLLNEFSICELANVPDRYYFEGKNLYNKNDVCTFELYKTSSGNKVHLIKGCSGANISINISEFDASKYQFCKKCFNSKNNSLVYQMLVYGFPKWYENYMFFYDLKYSMPIKGDELLQFLKLLNQGFNKGGI